jgi:hypothetical protein
MPIDEVSETIGPATTILAGKPNSPLQFRSVEVDVSRRDRVLFEILTPHNALLESQPPRHSVRARNRGLSPIVHYTTITGIVRPAWSEHHFLPR